MAGVPIGVVILECGLCFPMTNAATDQGLYYAEAVCDAGHLKANLGVHTSTAWYAGRFQVAYPVGSNYQALISDSFANGWCAHRCGDTRVWIVFPNDERCYRPSVVLCRSCL